MRIGPADSPARDVGSRHVDRAAYLDLDDPGTVADIDGPEDYRALVGAAPGWLVVGLGSPSVNADPYADRLRGSLSRALGRQTEFRSAGIDSPEDYRALVGAGA